MRLRFRLLAIGLLIGVLWGSALAQIAVTLERLPDPPQVATARLLTDQGATTDGVWASVKGIQPMAVMITGITTATVEIDGSNAPTQPANNTHGIKLNTLDITSNQIVAIDLPVAWLKVRVTAWTSGTINAYLVGYTR